MTKLAIFASGSGTNADQITSYFKSSQSEIEVDCILTNKKEAGVIAVAKKHRVPHFYFSNAFFENGEQVVDFLKDRKINWIILAGFLRKIVPEIIQHFPGRIINIHPSLLPQFGGKGMYGAKVHQAVIDHGEKESGISIHIVNENFDQGKIIFQKKCLLESEETAESLSKKVQLLEHRHFPEVIEKTVLLSRDKKEIDEN